MRNHSSSAHPPLPDEVCREALPSFILYQIRVREQACWINNPGKRACHAPCFEEEEVVPETAALLGKRILETFQEGERKDNKGTIFFYRDLISCFMKTT